jgi:hypothetical protein
VRTGRDGLTHLFGQSHLDHFVDHPELAELFHRAVAAEVSIFGRVSEVVDFSAGGHRRQQR